MEQQTAITRSSLPDPFDDVNTNNDVRRAPLIEGFGISFFFFSSEDNERESVLFSNSNGCLYGFISSITTLFF